MTPAMLLLAFAAADFPASGLAPDVQDWSAPARGGDCMHLTQPVQRGDAFARADVQLAECGAGETPVRVHFDRKSRLARASRDMLAGDSIPRIAAGNLVNAQRGEQVSVLLRSGSITVVRQAIVLRDSAGDNPVLVDMGDGATVALPSPRPIPGNE